MRVTGWREKARDGDIWRRIVKEAKLTKGCSATKEEDMNTILYLFFLYISCLVSILIQKSGVFIYINNKLIFS